MREIEKQAGMPSTQGLDKKVAFSKGETLGNYGMSNQQKNAGQVNLSSEKGEKLAGDDEEVDAV